MNPTQTGMGIAGSAELRFGGEHVVLLPQRAAWLPEHATLLIADTHWGKCEAFRSAGAPIPVGVMAEQLERLDTAVALTRASRVVVLGDLLHASVGITEAMTESARSWFASARSRSELRLELVPGNHDMKLGRERLGDFARAVGIDLLSEDERLGALSLRHIADAPGPTPVIAGHEHPAVALDASQFPLKVPAFWFPAPYVLVLPAFSRFTAGGSISPAQGGKGLYAVTDERVIALRAVDGEQPS